MVGTGTSNSLMNITSESQFQNEKERMRRFFKVDADVFPTLQGTGIRSVGSVHCN